MGMLVVALCAASAFLLSACGSSSSSNSTSVSTGTQTAAAAATGTSAFKVDSTNAKPVKMVLSNNFMGNEWRPQMVNGAKAVAANARFGGKVSLNVQISDPTPAAQIQSLQGIIRNKPDAILIDSASPTALNPTIAQACAAGITVVSFDQLATAPCAYKLPESYTAQGGDMARWMTKQLGGKGQILQDKGISGVALSEAFQAEWNKVFASSPGIKTVGTYNSNFSDGPETQGVAQQLAQNPNITGVLSDYSCAAVLAAFQKAGKTPKAIACNASNRSAIACIKAKVPCFLYGAPAWVGGLAVQKAFQIVNKQIKQPKTQYFFETNYLTPNAVTDFQPTQKIETLAPGKNYYPNEPPALITPISFGDYNLTPQQLLGGG